MSPMPWQHVVSICVMGLVLLLHAANIVHELWRAKFSLGGLWVQCPQHLDTSERETSLIAERLTDMRARYMRDLLNLWAHVCGVFAALHFISMILTDGIREILIGLSYAIALLCQKHPPLVNQNTIWMLHSAFMGLLMCDVTYMVIINPYLVTISNPGVQVIRISLALCYPEALPNFMWNAVWALVLAFAYLSGSGAFLGYSWTHVVGNEVIFWGLMSFGLRRFQQLQVALIRNEREAKGHLQEKSTMQKILSNMCHAVVELNRDLEISSPCPKLAGLLIRAESILAMQGEAFPALLYSDVDRDRFREFVSRRMVPVGQDDLDGEEDSSSIYVTLRDTVGHTVCVQVFHSCHQKQADEICHIIGIKELADDERAPPLQDAAAESTAVHIPNVERGPRRRTKGRRYRSEVQASDEEQPQQGEIVQPARQAPESGGAGSAENCADGTVEGDNSDGSSMSSRRSETCRYVAEGFRPTSAMAQRASLLHLLATWNVAIRRTGCCSHHALIQEAFNTCKCLLGTSCQPFHLCHSQAESWQCHNCGILAQSASAVRYCPLRGVCHYCKDWRTATFHLVEM